MTRDNERRVMAVLPTARTRGPESVTRPILSRVWALAAVGSVALLGTSCAGTATGPAGARPADRPAPSTKQVVLLHTNDDWGETEPCG